MLNGFAAIILSTVSLTLLSSVESIKRSFTHQAIILLIDSRTRHKFSAYVGFCVLQYESVKL